MGVRQPISSWSYPSVVTTLLTSSGVPARLRETTLSSLRRRAAGVWKYFAQSSSAMRGPAPCSARCEQEGTVRGQVRQSGRRMHTLRQVSLDFLSYSPWIDVLCVRFVWVPAACCQDADSTRNDVLGTELRPCQGQTHLRPDVDGVDLGIGSHCRRNAVGCERRRRKLHAQCLHAMTGKSNRHPLSQQQRQQWACNAHGPSYAAACQGINSRWDCRIPQKGSLRRRDACACRVAAVLAPAETRSGSRNPFRQRVSSVTSLFAVGGGGLVKLLSRCQAQRRACARLQD